MKELNLKLDNDFFQNVDLMKAVSINESNTDELLKQSIVSPLESIEEPPICLELENSIISTLGNFSMIIGKAKSKKTFLVSLLLSVMLRKNLLRQFKGNLPVNKSKVLYFDTEQSRYHVLKVLKRICRLINIDVPINLTAYCLRKYSPSERLLLIESAIYECKDLGFVVIDGIRDLITSINDEEQATMITSMLLKWSEELKIHIVCVLHQNKSDENARGHVGTELQNKAETVLSVSKDKTDNNISIVEAVHCREIEFKPFAFEINESGLPQLIDNWENSQEVKNKKTLPVNYEVDVHKNILKEIYSKQNEYTYKELLSQIKTYYALHGIHFGESKAKDFISHNMLLNLITSKKGQGNRTIYTFNS